ncbi:MAG: hypothetical protein ACYC8T_04185 [Myxococcaceae bacterium]
MHFDGSLTGDLSPLVKKDSGEAEFSSREPVGAVARFAPAVARRHFEQASWGEKKAERAVVIKSVAVSYSDGPHYEVKVVVDRYEGERRIGQATGTGYGYPNRTGERIGAAYAGPFAPIVQNNANQPKPEDDAPVLRTATVAALDSALLQLAAVWAGEQLAEKYRQDALPRSKAAKRKK